MGPRYVTIWDGLSVLFSLFLHRGEGTWREDSKIEWSERWNSAVAGSKFFWGANQNFGTLFSGNAPTAGKWTIIGARLSQIFPTLSHRLTLSKQMD